MLNLLSINHINHQQMTFEFYLPKSGTLKNIHLNLTDAHLKKTYSFKTSLRIAQEEWDKEKQRPTNIYVRKHKKLNKKLNAIRVHLAESLNHLSEGEKVFCQRTLAR